MLPEGAGMGGLSLAKKPKIQIVRPSARPSYDRKKANAGVMVRTVIVMLLFGVILFVPLFCQLFTLMISKHDVNESKAIGNQTRTTLVPADRGSIYDRNMKTIASSSTVETIFLDPLEIQHADEDVNMIAAELGRILNMDPERIREKAEKVNRRYEVIAAKQEWDVAEQVRAFINENKLTGIHLEPDSKRHYATPATAAQVVGFTNAENKGADGLEAYYDKLLQGTPGAIITTKGNYETDIPDSYEKLYEAQDGSSLVLTIDAQVQRVLEKNLEAAIEKYSVLNGAFAIMMDVNTGEIIGMAIEGSYDPNNYLEITDLHDLEVLDEISQQMDEVEEGSEEYQALLDKYNATVAADRLKMWRNRCVSDGYEPGSTFKTITLAAALEEGAVDLNTTYYCAGEKNYPGREATLHCWKPQGHGSQVTAQALQNSCNIAFADIGLKLGGEALYNYVEAFGLLEKTGIDMQGEALGVFHAKDEFVKNAQLTTIAFGQSVKPTPIQMVRAIAAVVNGGYLLKPYVVSEVLDEHGNVVQKNGRTVIRQVISKETSELMCNLIESVVTEGTGGNAKLTGYRIGGKTGSSEKLDVYDENGNQTDDLIVSFVGIVPMDQPKYICLVALDTPKKGTGFHISGGVMAAPVVRDIFADTLLYLGVQPDYTDVDMRTVNVQMPDVRDLTEAEAAQVLAAESLTYLTVGSGETVTGTIPAMDEKLPGNSQVILYMGEPVPTDKVVVPDLSDLTLAQANAVLANSGLYLQTKGSSLYYAVVTDQDYAAGTEVSRGTTITVELTDTTALD